MQPAKPSFLEYFEKQEKEKESNNHGESQNVANNADKSKIPAEVDMEVVSEMFIANSPRYVKGQSQTGNSFQQDLPGTWLTHKPPFLPTP